MKPYYLLLVMFVFCLKGQANDYSDSLFEAGDYYGVISNYKTLEIEGNCKAYNSIGVAYYMLNDFENASIYFFKTLSCSEKEGNLGLMSASYINIGLIHYEKRNYKEAVVYYTKAIEVGAEDLDAETRSFSLNNIGLAYLGMNDFEIGIEYIQKALVLNRQINDDESIADNYTNIGKAFSSMGEKYKAIEYYQKSIEINKRTDNIYTLTLNLGNIASIYFDLGKYQKAKDYAQNAIEIADELGDITLKRRSLRLLAEIHKELKQYDLAFEYLELYDTYTDSVFIEDKENTLYNLEVKYETAQKVNEIELLNKNRVIAEKELQNKNNIILFTTLSIALFILLSLFIYRGYLKSKKLNSVISASKEEIERKNKDITDSINYAKRIQTGMLSKYNVIKDQLNESFILFKPKDIVSGDFYWVEDLEINTLFSISDCTGHGVPGAFMSFIGHSGLNKIVKENKVETPGKVLDQLNTIVSENFTYSEEMVRDGMDMTLCNFNKQTRVLQFAGANNPMYIVRKSSSGPLENQKIEISQNGIDLYKITGDKEYIGGAVSSFSTKEFQLIEGDTIYLFTDGYADQFGGKKGKKMMYKRLQKLIIQNFSLPLRDQKANLENALLEWMENEEQVDDISLMGFKV